MWSMAASESAVSERLVSPADCHSHSNSFTNMHHSLHTDATAGSHAGKMPQVSKDKVCLCGNILEYCFCVRDKIR